MRISLKQALLFVPKDEHWFLHVLIGGLLLFFPSVIYIFPGIKRLLFNPVNYYCIAVFSVLALTIFITVCGYFFKTVHNRIVHSADVLPSWKYFGYYFYVGLKAYLGGFLFSLPFLVVFSLIAAMTPVSVSLEGVPFILSAVVLHIIYTACYLIAALSFSLDLKVTSFFNVKNSIGFIQDNLTNFGLVIAYSLILAVVSLLLNILLISGQILGLLVPFVSFYICLVYTDLFAQLAQSKEKIVSNYHEEKCMI